MILMMDKTNPYFEKCWIVNEKRGTGRLRTALSRLTASNLIKHMRPNPLAPWELRIGDLRIYYDIQAESEPTVLIVAIGLKRGNRLCIAGEEIEL